MVTNQILCGDSLQILKTLPAESVDMVMTSPPYWAQRDYGTEAQVWGGQPDCIHQWDVTNTSMHNGRGDCQKGAKYSQQEPVPDRPISHSTCTKCGAWNGSLGLEPSPQMFITHLCDIFDEVKRVLKKEGTCWVNLGDCYGGPSGEPNAPKLSQGRNVELKSASGLKSKLGAKSLCLIPHRFAIEMTDRGWILRNQIIWHKPNAMPSSVKDRFTIDYEPLFFFSKSQKYYFKTQREPLAAATIQRNKYTRIVKEGSKSRNYNTMNGLHDHESKGNGESRIKRCVWTIATARCKEAHFATYPEALCEIPIDAGCPPGGTVLDPFAGIGTTGVVANRQGKSFLGIELNPEYVRLAAT